MAPKTPSDLVTANPIDLGRYEILYKDLHSHPELSLQESRTANAAASFLRILKVFDIHTDIGGHGLAGVFENGLGKTVLLRADMDALPVLEKTGLDYASTQTMKDVADNIEKPVMHACGHDMHVACLLAAAEQLVQMRDTWSGTLIVLFQPNEERGAGAKAMLDGGLYDKVPVPDVVLGQHVMARRTGSVGTRVGTCMAASNSLRITIFGRGGHGSMPNRTIDPVIMAANVVNRLQTIVSREVDPSDMAVVTVGSLQAGSTENIISDVAEIKVNVRTIESKTRDHVLAAIRRIVTAECEASNAPKQPRFEETSSFPMTVNDQDVTQKLSKAFGDHFQSFDADQPRTNASEDFSLLGTSIDKPCCFWFFGGVDAQQWDEAEKNDRLQEDIPVNHSPFFAPTIQPTMKMGVDALSLAALTFLDVKT